MRVKIIQDIIDFIRNKKNVEVFFYNENLQITPDDIKRIENYLTQKSSRKAKSVLYTCITNDYDDIEAIKTYKYVNPDWDYVCFTDNEEHIKQGQIGIWEIRPLQFNELDNTRNQRWHKTNPHILFPNYEQSIWIDGNINIISDYISKCTKENKSLLVPQHFKNKCIYQEYKDVIRQKYDDLNLVKAELEILKSDKMPKNYGMTETNILIRRHHDETILNLDNSWWDMINKYSKRDQLAFSYLMWKLGILPSDVYIKNTRLSPEDFYVFGHKVKR